MKNKDWVPKTSMIIRMLFFLLSGTFSYGSSQAQVKIGENPSQIGKASLLELESETQGLLLPRLSDTVAINALSPANGMLIYLAKAPGTGLYIRKNGAWDFLNGPLNVNGTTLHNPINNATQIALDLKATTINLDLKASTASMDLKAPNASPAFTGTVTGITSAMVGLAHVNNTTDAAKPISTATQTALDLKEPVMIAGTAAQYVKGDKTLGTMDKTALGLTNVDNTTDAAKPISVATQTALNTKLNAADLALAAPLASPAFTGIVSGITKSMVGLENADNTTDAGKPVSNAAAAALAGKEPLVPAGTSAQYLKGDKTLGTLDKSAIGLSNADNTTDAAKPISTATQNALDSKVNAPDLALKAPLASPAFTGTVSGITKSMVGLENADNTTDAGKPVSTAANAALAGKEPLIAAGTSAQYLKGDKTLGTLDKAALGLSNVDNTSDTAKPVGTATQAALDLKASAGSLAAKADQGSVDLKAPLASPAFTGTVTGITSTMVGLGNIDNTSDINKPISSAAVASMALKAPLASPAFTGTVSGITPAMVGLNNVNNTSDLLKPISNATQIALNSKADASALASKADQSEVDLKAPIASPAFTGTVSGINSAMVGLDKVDNTTDAAKPISTAAQTALDLKADLTSPSFTGVPLAPTAIPGTNTAQVATTAFVLANLNGYSSVNAGTEISTTSTTDEVATGMTLTPGAGIYSVMFNGQYESSSAGVTGQGVTGLTAAYNQISGYTTTGTHALVFGSGETIGPGVYSVAGAGSIAGNLTLNAGENPNAIFIFKIDGAFTTGAGTVIILAGQAKASNVFWITTSSYAIGLGAATTMKGTLIAHNGAISMGAGSNLEGRLMSTSGAVSFGPGIAALPTGTSVIDLSGVANFVLFTSSGGVANTGNSAITGNIGTNNGAITGFETSTVNGSFFTPVTNGDALATFSIYQNGVLVANSSRSRTSTVNTVDVALQAIATVAAGQAVDIRWNTSVGILKLKNRILTLMKVQ